MSAGLWCRLMGHDWQLRSRSDIEACTRCGKERLHRYSPIHAAIEGDGGES